jgi:DNA-binding transcriptional regulator YdaS (Cro superfamily)
MILTTDVTKGCGEIQRNAGRESVSAVEIRLTEPDVSSQDLIREIDWKYLALYIFHRKLN